MDFSELSKLAGGYAEARAIQTAVELDVFEALTVARNAGDVASTIRCDVRATELLLNALVAIGLLSKQQSIYSLNETSLTYLVKSSSTYLGGMILFDAASWKFWGDLGESVRTGKPARTADMYQRDPKETARFITAMDSLVHARGDAEIVAEKLDLTQVGDLLDVGSGPGTYPVFFCRKHPALRVTIFDLPATLKVTERFIAASGVREQITLIDGDYRNDPIPGKYQLVFLSNIIHAESSKVNEQLMAKLYGCLEHGGGIVLKDHFLDDSKSHPSQGALFALLMLLTTEGGRCYSFSEVNGWLENAGFQRIHEITLPPPLTSSLVIGIKP